MGPSIKDVRTKSRKIDSLPLVRKMSAQAQPPSPLSVRTHYNFEKSESFCAKNCGRPHLKNPSCPRNVRTEQTPSPLSADVFYGWPLLTSLRIKDNSKITPKVG